MKSGYNILIIIDNIKDAHSKKSQVRKCSNFIKAGKQILISIIVFFILTAFNCSNSIGSTSKLKPKSSDFTFFKNPELIKINGYNDNAMEPFLSSDGNYLFFNNNTGNATGKDLYYAIKVNNTTFNFQGAITSINTTKVDGVPTLDIYNKFYYITTFFYNPPTNYYTVYSGEWNGSIVKGDNHDLLGKLFVNISLVIYFDVEVSKDGSTLYLSRGDFNDANGLPKTADIKIAVNTVNGFCLDPNSDLIMVNINTDKLEYAPAISSDELELIFTRLDMNTKISHIYRATRSAKSMAFGVPQLISAIEGFVEGPAFSPDEKSLYYHRLNTNTLKFEIYRVTR